MSSEDNGPDGNEQDGGQGGQPTGGQGQPAGGQPAGGQPQGGQPAGGQPAGGQPAGQAQGPPPQGGQAAGGYQQGRAPAGQSVGDIFSKPSTMNQIQAGIVFYALAGLGTAIGGFLFVNQYVSGQGFGAQSFGAFTVFSAAFILGPLLAVPVGFRIVDGLAGAEQDSQIYATAAVATLVGNIVFMLLFRIVIALELNGDIQFGELLISSIGGGIGAAIVAAGVAYLVLNDGQWQPA